MRKRLDIKSLRQERGEKEKQIDAIQVKAEAENREITQEELGQVDNLLTEIKALDGDIVRAEDLLAVKARGAKLVDGQDDAPVRVQVRDRNDEKGLALVAYIQAKHIAGGDLRVAAELASKAGFARVAKALSSGTATAGKEMVPVDFAQDFIPFLREEAIVPSLGARPVPMPNGNMTMPRVSGGATSAYVAENADIVKSEQTTDSIAMSAKYLTSLVPVSNQLINHMDADTVALVRDDMVSAMAETMDITFIRAAGSATVPKGIYGWTVAGNKVAAAAGAAPTKQVVNNELGRLMLRLRQAKMRQRRRGWILSPRSEYYLMNLVDGNGNAAFPEMQAGNLKGAPYRVTAQIPENLGGGAINTEIYYGEFTESFIGETASLEISLSEQAAYVEGGNLVSAFSRNQTVIRTILAHDFAVRYGTAFAVLEAVQWGS
jgi:HK97 family phage major capsid protein